MPELPSRTRSHAALRCWARTLSAALLLMLPRPYGREGVAEGESAGRACDDPPRYESMKIKGNSKSSYNPGERVEYECRPGYKQVSTLPVHTVCNDDGTWTALQEACTSTETTPGHASRFTPPPGLPQVLQSPRPASRDPAMKILGACFRLLGSKVLYCELVDNNMDWSGDPPLCEKILCTPPEKIPNGKYSNSHKEVFEYGEVVTYICNPSAGRDEYSLIGMNRRVCSDDGEWTGSPPRCEVVPNGMPRSIIPNKRNYNTTVSFDCLPGFFLQGSNIIRCDEDSSWKPAVPTCVPGSKPKVTTPTQASRDPSSKPTSATPTATSRVPGDVIPSDQPPETSGHLGPGIIAVIVLIVVVGVILASLGVYKYVQSGKKRETKGSEASFSTYRSKSSSPVEESK
ncbi:membrane cofactor protein [Sorex araneus]|uniref:membrane cofactor protein n=1 Tax=Sorex araneus TaxID=42254 RepID=UPI0024336E62|nr:membrane cofactor protein [Sorex araneus]